MLLNNKHLLFYKAPKDNEESVYNFWPMQFRISSYAYILILLLAFAKINKMAALYAQNLIITKM